MDISALQFLKEAARTLKFNITPEVMEAADKTLKKYRPKKSVKGVRGAIASGSPSLAREGAKALTPAKISQ